MPKPSRKSVEPAPVPAWVLDGSTAHLRVGPTTIASIASPDGIDAVWVMDDFSGKHKAISGGAIQGAMGVVESWLHSQGRGHLVPVKGA